MGAAVSICVVPLSCCYIDCVICSHPERGMKWKNLVSALTMEVTLPLQWPCPHDLIKQLLCVRLFIQLLALGTPKRSPFINGFQGRLLLQGWLCRILASS